MSMAAGVEMTGFVEAPFTGSQPLPDGLVVHATAVSVDGRAALLAGPSGAGKSGLALQMMALGAGLIADDRTLLRLVDGVPVATCPPALRGRIEARGIGILAAEPSPPAPVALVVDLGQSESARLPEPLWTELLGQKVRLLRNMAAPHLAAALVHCLRGGLIVEEGWPA